MKFFKSKHSYMATTWILNIIIVFICTSAIFIGLASFYTKKRLDSFLSYNVKMQEGIQAMIDHSLDTVRYSAFNTFYSPDVERLRHSDNLNNYEMIQGTRSINSLASTNTYIHSVYVYNKDVNKVFTTHLGTLTKENFDDIDVFNQKYDQPTPRNLKVNNKHIWVYTLTFKDFKEENSSLVVNIDANMFNNSIFTTDQADEYLYIPSVNKTFYSENNQKIRDIDELAHKFNHETGYVRLPNKHLLFYSSMPNLGWTFIKEIDQSLIGQSDAMILSFSFIIFSIISMMFGLLYLNIKKRYHKPLRSIIDEFNIDDHEDARFNAVLHQWINSQKIQGLKIEENKKQDHLEQIILGQCQNCIQDIVTNIDFLTGFHMTLFRSDALLIDTLEEYMKDIPYEIVFLGKYTVLFTQQLHKEHFLNMSDALQISIIQSRHCMINDAKDGFDNLKEIDDLIIMNPSLLYRDESNLPDFSIDLDQTIEYETNFLQSLMRTEQQQAWDALNQWYDSLKNVRYTSILFFYNKLFVRLRILIAEELPEEPIISIREFEERLRNTNDIKHINHYIEHLAYRYLDYHESKKENRILNLISNVKTFIDKNICDPNFSTNCVSEEFDLSSTHLSRLFKTYETYSVSEYITISRLDRACNLLINTDRSIKDISKDCGIINTPYFYTVFKKYFDCSPSQYRKNNKIKK
ncbi:helix-turn-helix transcriptional regulator [Erysipelothrix urinaevulpis]|uniref:helix-turn-helix transcriptional regulator n=1 Tax=Erysipelothrix urinaevulpis TaxID=2683717 RepID=UPI0013598634|nr:helix-turn-helix domain-containing protein [Erysipelothrix urinaevulpis]